MKLAEKNGTDKITVIWDRHGFEKHKNYDERAFEFMKKFTKIVQENYAERLHKMYILNANWFFKLVFNTVKNFMSKNTRRKIFIIDDLSVL